MAKSMEITLRTDEGTFHAEFPVGLKARTGSITLTDIGQRKINCIKEIRAFTGKGLKDAKLASEMLPFTFAASDLEGVKGERGLARECTLEDFATALEAHGATVERGTATDGEVALAADILAAFMRAA